jgi:hypothetical protein
MWVGILFIFFKEIQLLQYLQGSDMPMLEDKMSLPHMKVAGCTWVSLTVTQIMKSPAKWHELLNKNLWQQIKGSVIVHHNMA